MMASNARNLAFLILVGASASMAGNFLRELVSGEWGPALGFFFGGWAVWCSMLLFVPMNSQLTHLAKLQVCACLALAWLLLTLLALFVCFRETRDSFKELWR